MNCKYQLFKEPIFVGSHLKKWSKLGVRRVFGMENLMVQTVLIFIDFVKHLDIDIEFHHALSLTIDFNLRTMVFQGFNENIFEKKRNLILVFNQLRMSMLV